MAIKCKCPNCDRSYSLADTMAGKTIRCKECEETFTVEDADEGVMSSADARRKRTAAVAASSRRSQDDDEDDKPRRRSKDREDDDEDEDEGPPKKKKKKGGAPVGLIIACVVGVLLLIGGGVLAVVFLAGGARLTMESFAKVKDGMTEAEVIALIGSPKETKTTGTNSKQLVFSSQNGNETMTVSLGFTDGKTVYTGHGSKDSQTASTNPPAANPPAANPPAANPPTANPPTTNPPFTFPPDTNPPVFNPPAFFPPNQGPGITFPPTTNPQQPPKLPILGGSVSKEAVAQLRLGMTEAEVVTLLGAPPKTVDAAEAGRGVMSLPPSYKRFDYGGGRNNGVEVFLLDGKVWSIIGMGRADMDQATSTRLTPPSSGPKPNPNPGVGPNPNPGIVPNPNPGVGPNPNPGFGPNPNPGTNPNPGIGPNPNQGMDGRKIQQLMQNMTEQQITTLLGQPIRTADIPVQSMAAKRIAANDVKLPDGSYKPAKSLVYPMPPGQPGQLELILIDGKLYRYGPLQ
jgi:outer membrane protein assembly factor BamE (lipoprotein component of BamABCDE complex)